MNLSRKEAYNLFLRAAATLKTMHAANPPRECRIPSDYTLLDAAEVAHSLADMLRCGDRMLARPEGREALASFITLQVSDYNATGRARKLFAAILRAIQ